MSKCLIPGNDRSMSLASSSGGSLASHVATLPRHPSGSWRGVKRQASDPVEDGGCGQRSKTPPPYLQDSKVTRLDKMFFFSYEYIYFFLCEEYFQTEAFQIFAR